MFHAEHSSRFASHPREAPTPHPSQEQPSLFAKVNLHCGTRGRVPAWIARLETWCCTCPELAVRVSVQFPVPSVGDIDTAERFGGRVATIARRFKDGVAFDTERISEAEVSKAESGPQGRFILTKETVSRRRPSIADQPPQAAFTSRDEVPLAQVWQS